jgi:hypothetical protein
MRGRGEVWNWRVGRAVAVIVVSFMVKKSMGDGDDGQGYGKPNDIGYQ